MKKTKKSTYKPTREKLIWIQSMCDSLRCGVDNIVCKKCHVSTKYQKLTGLGLEELGELDVINLNRE